jgi:hypothetical protein
MGKTMTGLAQFAPGPYVWIPSYPRGLGLSRPLSTAEMAAIKYGIPLPGRSLQGLGAALTGGAATADSIAASGAAATVSILVALNVVAPVIGTAIAALVALAAKIASLFGGCGQTCVLSSDDANQVGDYMTQNLNAYLAAPVHYQSLQAAALNNFDTAWASLVAACSNPQLGTAGKNCISERQEGACFWKASPGGWSQANGKWTYTGYGPAGSGNACWNYFVGMRDPIAQDPTVVPDPTSNSTASTGGSGSTASTGSATTGTSPDLAPLLVIGGLIGLALLL